MQSLNISSNNNNIILSFDKSKFNFDEINDILNYFKLESLIKDADFNSNVLEFENEIKNSIWEKRKNRVIN